MRSAIGSTFQGGFTAFLVGTLLWLPDAVAQSGRPGRTVSAVFSDPGDHWADAMPHGHIGRATRDKKYGYEVDFRGDDGCRVTVFWPRDKIDFRGERPRYRLIKRKVTSGWFWYPDKLTADSLPKVHEWVMEIEGDYQRQADAAIAGAKGFLVVATVGSVAPAPRVPLPPARAGAVGRSSSAATRARPISSSATSAASRGLAGRAATAASRYPKQVEQARKMSPQQLRRSIQSFSKQITEHRGYLNNPQSHVPSWNQLTHQHHQSLIHHWTNDIARHEAYRDIAEAVLQGIL